MNVPSLNIPPKDTTLKDISTTHSNDLQSMISYMFRMPRQKVPIITLSERTFI